MVTPTGLEPVTSRLGISRSILMSYGAKPAKNGFIKTHPTLAVFILSVQKRQIYTLLFLPDWPADNYHLQMPLICSRDNSANKNILF